MAPISRRSRSLPADAVHPATQEYIAVLDDAGFGAATPVVPTFISPADSAARWSAANGGFALPGQRRHRRSDAAETARVIGRGARPIGARWRRPCAR